MERDKVSLYATAILMYSFLAPNYDRGFRMLDEILVDKEMKAFIKESGRISQLSIERLEEIVREMKVVARLCFRGCDFVSNYFILRRVDDSYKEGPFSEGSFEGLVYDPIKGEVAIAILKCQFLFRMYLNIGLGVREYALVVARRLAITAIDALEFVSEVAKEALDDYVEFKRRRRE